MRKSNQVSILSQAYRDHLIEEIKEGRRSVQSREVLNNVSEAKKELSSIATRHLEMARFQAMVCLTWMTSIPAKQPHLSPFDSKDHLRE